MSMKNTYVECINWTWEEKLLYIKSCIGDSIPHKKLCGHGYHTKEDILNKYTKAKFLYCHGDGMVSFDGVDVESPSSVFGKKRKLTLSDLKLEEKPRTKVEYEKVALSLSEKVGVLESGEWLYLDPDGKTHIDMNVAGKWVIESLMEREVYRKVERPVEWWEDAAEYIESLGGECKITNRDGGRVCIYLNSDLDERQAKDFARILLEQEDENQNNASS